VDLSWQQTRFITPHNFYVGHIKASNLRGAQKNNKSKQEMTRFQQREGSKKSPICGIIDNVKTRKKNMENILVPIDFSDGSKKALQYAVHFAKQFRLRLILLHVLSHSSSGNREGAGRLKAWAEEFVPGDVPVQIHLSRGAEAIEIVNMAKEVTAGLMVISTRGRTGRARALAGSLAESLVQLAPCPVLVVREHERDFIQAGAAKNESEATPDFIGMAI
jgi:universal stress protein A